MSLQSALAAENDLMSRLSPNRGRDASLSPTNTSGHMRSTSRGRDRGRSSSRRRQTSRQRSQGEDANYRWSLLTHDPFERFEPKSYKPSGTPGPKDDLSDEEQVSDDEGEFDYDIAEVKLPNFRCSINDNYKRRSSAVSSQHTKAELASMEITRQNLLKKTVELEKLSELQALDKAIQEAVDTKSPIPVGIKRVVQDGFAELGVSHGRDAKAQDLLKLDNKMNKAIEEYKKNIIAKSSKPTDVIFAKNNSDKKIVKSELERNLKNLRACRSVTLGNFFDDKRKASDVNTYLMYMDQGTDSQVALQYTVGSTVKSGDVLYIINTSDNEHDDINFFERNCESLTNSVITNMKLIYDPDFTLHVVVESTYRAYTKHFITQLVRYLKPTLFIISFQLLQTTDKLANYITACPFQVVKKKPGLSTRRKSNSGI